VSADIDVTSEGVWYDHCTEYGGHTSIRGHVYGVTPFAYQDCGDYGCRQVVVIDPESREQVERLRDLMDAAYNERTGGGSGTDFRPQRGERGDALQAALRNFITPPKPPEPTGLGAVVEEADGMRWTLIAPKAGRWANQSERSRSYLNINARRVISQGVQP